MSNVIYRGPVEREPQTINLPVSVEFKPGAFAKISAGKLAVAADGAGRIFLVSNRRFMEQSINDSYAANETAVAFRLEAEQEYQALAVKANYADQAELTITSGGALKAATTGEDVIAFVDGAKNITADAGGLLDIVISNRYKKA